MQPGVPVQGWLGNSTKMTALCCRVNAADNQPSYSGYMLPLQIMFYHERVGATERLMRQPIPVAYTRCSASLCSPQQSSCLP